MGVVHSPHTGDNQYDESYLEYAPIRIVARKEEPVAPTVADDEWDTEPARDKPQDPIYLSQYLKQQKHKEREQESTSPVPSSSFARPNQLLNETDRTSLREQEQQRQAKANSGAVELDEWDEEPTPSVPSKPLNLRYTPSGVSMTSKKPTFGGGGEICRRCQKIVYHAEQARAHGSVYHKLCLRCAGCQKSVDATNMVDRQGTPYCTHCYSKEFGAKGYGYGSGAHVLHTEL